MAKTSQYPEIQLITISKDNMKNLIISAVCLGVISACSVNYETGSAKADKSTEVENYIEANEPSTPEQKAQLAKEMQEHEKITKIKCQDAKLDLVEAEATKNMSIIKQVTTRIQKYCDDK
ncbi:hypothetical protein RS130_10715 [Paraglaciecola aquimarina]|uniref:Lipoprotein n=1 Tax=Paraglaciecola aquimarina TaxID=1235557 RepID=A0ABU3SWF9_9ALTE|nr:hypothetical protein [Paraglaciecola aquimarina]MDU0354339.1 hypothetical protein [Paraglaciecola aquimarina]